MKEYKVISAYYNWKGNRIEGNENIKVEIHYFKDAPIDEA